ncbi:molybdopterin-guanine dinucleotide biosynthesis protein B [Thermodesulfitimonas sp.]
MNATALVLAGGKSTRMGENKALLRVDGRPLVARVVAALRAVFPEVIISGDVGLFAGYADRVVEDIFKGVGPLGGIHAGLVSARYEVVFVAACDLPFADGEVAAFITGQVEGFDAAVPCVAGRLQPLFAAYRKSCLEPITKILERGERRVAGFFPAVRVRYLTEADFVWRPGIERVFFNVNTPADLARLRAVEDFQRERAVGGTSTVTLGERAWPVPVLGVVGRSGSGKTGLVVQLVAALREAGYRIAVLKHTRHPLLDTPGKDTDRFMRAGASKTALVGPGGFFCFQDGAALSFEEAVELLGRDVDMVIVEGWREAPIPQVRVLAPGEKAAIDARTVAVVSGEPLCLPVRVFHPGDVAGMVTFLGDHFLKWEARSC